MVFLFNSSSRILLAEVVWEFILVGFLCYLHCVFFIKDLAFLSYFLSVEEIHKILKWNF